MLLLLTVGYYAAYLYKFRGAPARGEGGGLWLTVSAVLFFLIATIHVAVNLVHAQPEIVPQWGNFVLFAVLLVAGLATVGYMVQRVLDSSASGGDAA